MMKQIPLTHGLCALVDDTDYDWLSQWRWFAHKNNHKESYYAERKSSNNKNRHIKMHRQILGLEHGDGKQGDHKDHNTLDNRRENIRICSNQQNQQNRIPRTKTTSKYKGVSWHKHSKKWRVRITINEGLKYLGYFRNEEDAARAYNEAAKKYFGEFAYLNKIP